MRKGLGINFVGETRDEMMIYLLDAYVDGFPVDDQVSQCEYALKNDSDGRKV